MNHRRIQKLNSLLAAELGRDPITAKPLHQWTYSAPDRYPSPHTPSLLYRFRPTPATQHIFGSGMEEVTTPGGLIVGLQIPIQTIWLGLHIDPPRWIICSLHTDPNGLNPGGHYTPFEFANGTLGMQVDQEPTLPSTQAVIQTIRQHDRENTKLSLERKRLTDLKNWHRPLDSTGNPNLAVQAPVGSMERKIEDDIAGALAKRDPRRPGASGMIYSPAGPEHFSPSPSPTKET